MQSFYVTMGQSHTHHINGRTIDKDSVVEIRAKDKIAARKYAFATFGAKWSNLHSELPDMSYYPRGVITTLIAGEDYGNQEKE